MERYGLNVVANEPLSEILLAKLPTLQADVILFDVDERTEKHHGMLEQLLDRTELPIIFNDASGLTINEPLVMAKWYQKLMAKIAELTGKPEWEELDIDLAWASKPAVTTSQSVSQEGLAKNIWVLGASLGGPEALKQFLAAIPADLPVAFILAQHLGTNFMSLLAEQLDRVSTFKVVLAQVGHVLHHQEVLVVPVNERLHISPIGTVELHPLEVESAYSPSIDSVLVDMAQRYGYSCNTIIFSGMCDDGVKGAQFVSRQGGQVWTQEANSCVISAMPESVRQTGCCHYSGTPQQLAVHITQYYQS